MVLKEQGGPLTEKQKKMLQEAERSCERISALVAELSELGKLESNELVVARQELILAAFSETWRAICMRAKTAVSVSMYACRTDL